MQELSAAAWEHFSQPRNIGAFDSADPDVIAVRVGSPVGGEILQLHLRIAERNIIAAARFKAYGCGWMIACGSLLTECIAGQAVSEAAQFRHHRLVEQLAVPPEKLHCAVLAETALSKALHRIFHPHTPTNNTTLLEEH